MKPSRSSQKVRTKQEFLDLLAEIALTELLKEKEKENKNGRNTRLQRKLG